MAENEKKDADRRMSVIKIYVKDFSFESPQAPAIFNQQDWSPKTNLNLRSSHTPVDDRLHEVVLTITIEARDKDETKTLFLVELQQAGLFEITGYPQEEMAAVIGSFCPNLLFPYVRESIASIVQKGGFPEFILQPINFDALYLQSLKQYQEKLSQAGAAEKH